MSDPSTLGHGRPSDRGRAVAVALGVVVALTAALVIGVVVARSGDGGGRAAPATTSTAPATTTAATAPATTVASATSSTTVPAPATVVAASDQRLVVLESRTGGEVRTLFDLGPSVATDQEPAAVGSVALSADGRTAFFDVLQGAKAAAMKRVPVDGGAVEDLGAGRAPAPSPDGSLLAFLRSEEGSADSVALRAADGSERRVALGPGDTAACGTVAWAPDGRRIAVDLCSNGEPTTVAEIDVPKATATTLSPPGTVRWIAPAYRPDGVLTLAEDRDGDSVVVPVTNGRASGSAVLRRDRTTLVCLDWDRATSLLFCEADGSVWVDPVDADAHVVGTGYHAAAW